MQALGRARRTKVLSETRHECRPAAYSGPAGGPIVRRVPRRTASRANGQAGTTSRTRVQNPEAVRDGKRPIVVISRIPLLRLHGQLGWIVMVSCFPEAEGERGELPR